MEAGSLLPEALRYMQQLREREQSQNADTVGFSDGDGDGSGSSDTNTLILSLYCIDNDANASSTTTTTPTTRRKRLLQKLGRLHSIIHSKILPLYHKRYPHQWYTGGEGMVFGIHCEPSPSPSPSTESESDAVPVPHLRAIIRYGPHPLDEHYAMAMMMCLSKDLHTFYKMDVAIECWDVEDGQILLIEGSGSGSGSESNDVDALPSWVDDVIGVEDMRRRVYIVNNGKVAILPPSIKGEGKGKGQGQGHGYSLTRNEALRALALETCNNAGDDNYNYNYINKGFNDVLHSRLKPFLTVLNEMHTHKHTGTRTRTGTRDPQVQRSLLSDYLHTAAIILPLPLALMIQVHPSSSSSSTSKCRGRGRPDLIPIAIASFCQHAATMGPKTRKLNTNTVQCSWPCSWIPFENLVFCKITLPQTLYAMLLTGAGILPPPIAIPKHYKSIEYKRMKRQCAGGRGLGCGYGHFRHALEVGVRLSLGFEWLLGVGVDGSYGSYGSKGKSSQSQTQTAASASGKAAPQDNQGSMLMSCTPQERISSHMARIDRNAGGDGVWIGEAWRKGPNAIGRGGGSGSGAVHSSSGAEDDISDLIKCPVWDPEIVRGGICPIGHPGKEAHQHINEAMKKARKKESELTSRDISDMFPTPKANEVDSDEWIDFNSVDDLESKMKELVGGMGSMGMTSLKNGKTNRSETGDGNGESNDDNDTGAGDDNEDANILGMNEMLKNLEQFVEGKSDIEGISSSAGPTPVSISASSKNKQMGEGKDDKENELKAPPPSTSTNLHRDGNGSKSLSIHSGIFLEILHRTLKADDGGSGDVDDGAFTLKLDDIGKVTKSSPLTEKAKGDNCDEFDLLRYFTKEDLDFEENESEDEEMKIDSYLESSVGDVHEQDQDGDDIAMKTLMKAMDEELAMENSDLDRDSTEYCEEISNLSSDDPTAMKAKILSNLLESLDSQGGSSGPVSTLLAEMKGSRAGR